MRYDRTKDKLIITNTYTPDKPEFDKKTADVNDSYEVKPEDISAFDANRWQDSADHDIGDAVPYRLTATLADDVSAYHKYHVTFTDQMEQSLTFNKIERVTITPKDGVETDVEAGSQGDLGKYVFNKVDGQNFTLRIDWAGPNGGEGYIGDDENLKLDEAVVHVYFTATLNEDAKLGKQGNVNGAKLAYSNKPSSEDDSDEDEEETPWDYVIAFTYKVDVNKVDEDKQALEDAEFKLEKQIAGKDNADPTWEEVSLTKAGSLFSAKGLDDGIYRLTEVTAPDNHRKIDPIIIEVTAEHGAKWNYISDEFDANGQGRLEILTNLEGTQTNASETEGKLTLTTDKNLATLAGDLVNTKLGELVIQKNVTVNGKETTSKEADGTYTFEVTGPAEFEEADRVTKTATIEITDGKSNTATVDHLYAGTYTVTELTDQSTNKAMKLLGVPARDVTVENGKSAKVNTVSFTNTKPGTPDFEKKIKDTNDSTGKTSGWQDSADYDIGDAVPYKLTAKLPNDVTSYKKYHITFSDKMESTLDYNKDAMVKVIGADGKEITDGFAVDDSVKNDHDFVVRLDWAGEGEGDEQQTIADANLNGATVEVEFTATLNKTAKRGKPGNVNKSQLKYSNSPQIDELDREDETPWDYVIAFTYDVDLSKVNEKSEPLEGAEFKLEKRIAGKDGADPTWELVELISNGGGEKKNIFKAEGLDDGTYRLTETKAPKGYKLLDPVTFVVEAEHGDTWDYIDAEDDPTFADRKEHRLAILTSLTGNEETGALKLEADEALAALKSNVENTPHDTPEFEKKIKDTNDSTGETSEWQDSADYDIGDAVPYKLTATLADDVTNYFNYHITFVDKMEPSLTFSEIERVTIKPKGGTERDLGKYVFASANDREFTVRIDWAGESEGDARKQIADKSLNEAEVNVYFTATLNSNAKLGKQGNVNGCKLIYSNTSTSDDDKDDTEETPWDYVIAFTYKVDVSKFDAADEQPLKGAEFTLEKIKLDEDGQVSYEYDQDIDDYKVTNKIIASYPVEVAGNTFTFKGLDDGTYLLTETTAPTGYDTITPVVFEVVAGHVTAWDHASEGEEPNFADTDERRLSLLETLTGDVLDGDLELTANEQLDGLAGNVYDTELGKLQIQKVIRGRSLTRGADRELTKKQREAYTFTVTDEDGNVLQIDGKPAVKTLAEFTENTRNNTLTWTIDNLKVGTYRVIEQRSQGDDPSYVWAYQLGQNGRVRVTANRIGRVKITNVWEGSSGDAQLAVTKKVQSTGNGGEFQYDGNEEFTFTLEKANRDENEAETEFVDELPAVGEEPGTEVTVTRKADGTYTTENFGKIKYASIKAHDYFYKITEVEPENPTPGMTYNMEPQYALVRVLGGDGFDYRVYYGNDPDELVRRADDEEASDEAATVVNKYQVGQLKVVKTLAGVEDLSPNEYQNKKFTVTVQDENGRYLGLEDGKTVFSDEEITNTVSPEPNYLEFTRIPAGKYTVTETNTGDITEIEGRAFVPEESKLEATASVEIGKTAEAKIVNKFVPNKGKALLRVKKNLVATPEGSYTANEDFEFKLEKVDEGTDKLPESTTIKVKAGETGTFDAIAYEDAGTYIYTITEVAPAKKTYGVTYDTTPRYATVVVDDNLMTTVRYYANKADCDAGKSTETNEHAEVTNTYKPADGTLSVKKVVESDVKADKEKEFPFEVTLKTATGAEGEVREDVNGTYGDMTFEKGVAKFTLKDGEVRTATGLPLINSKLYYRVRETDAGGLKADLSEVKSENEASSVVTCTNKRQSQAQLAVTKQVLGENYKGNEEFEFKLDKVDLGLKKSDVLPQNTSVKVKAGATGTFDNIIYTEPGTYWYTITEVEPENKTTGMSYDTTPNYVAVTVNNDMSTSVRYIVSWDSSEYTGLSAIERWNKMSEQIRNGTFKDEFKNDKLTVNNRYTPPTEEGKKTTTATTATSGRAGLATTSDPTSFVGIIALVIVGVAGIVFGITRRRNK